MIVVTNVALMSNYISSTYKKHCADFCGYAL